MYRINHKAVSLVKTRIGILILMLVIPSITLANDSADDLSSDLAGVVIKIEEKLEARIGVVLRDTGSDWSIKHRSTEFFPLSSTFKPLLCGAILARVDAGEENLSRLLKYKQDALVTYSPVTKLHVNSGMTIDALCEATITTSDNTAGNILLETIGGPKGLTGFLRRIGDDITRLDRWETKLNEAKPGDMRDTTTPMTILATLEKILFGDVLTIHSRKKLQDWMIDDQVADALIRSHLPATWKIADKSGAGGFGSRSIIAVIWPPQKKPYLAAVYLTQSDADFPTRNKALADIGQAIIDEIAKR